MSGHGDPSTRAGWAETGSQRSLGVYSLPLAKLTNRLSSPNALPSLLPSPASTLAALSKCGRTFPPVFVGENRWLDVGENRFVEDVEVTMRSDAAGSMSSEVRNEVSARSSLVDVTDR
jgi:hypothetical protein